MLLHLTGLALGLLSLWVALRIIGGLCRLLGLVFNVVLHLSMHRGRLWPPD
jgi:hypothetical protein